jgi:glycosyltransferase involved in cell wall biosynthesis
MRILVIDNLFVPSKAGVIGNGAQKFTRNQVSLLSRENEVHYITAAGSDIQFPHQHVLKEHFDLSLSTKVERAAQTRRIGIEIETLCKRIKPDAVLDSAGRHMSSIWGHYTNGVIFEHYYKSSSPLGDEVLEKFTKKRVLWCGVSKWQQAQFRNFLQETINIHYIDNPPTEIKPAGDYGIFVSRWDAGKNPHVALKNYVKSGTTVPLKCFIKHEGEGINPKELENLKKEPLLSFHIDAPRSEILDAMAEAAFCFGAGNESTGIVSLECATYGVPYIVTARDPSHLAESEHMPDKYMRVNDRSSPVSVPEQIKNNIDFFMELGYNSRIELSKAVCERFTAEHFINEHYRVIDAVKNKYQTGDLNEFF